MQKPAPSVEELFFAALELEGSEARSAFLASHCGDPELRRRVEELLVGDAQGSRFLEAPASLLTRTIAHDPRPEVEEPGATIGPYELLEVIGQGGMGVVYVAEQHRPVRRRVALKVIKPGMDSRQVVARFEAERQALAMMDHPNIAKVHDAGTTPSGRPFFVMELVRGIPITEYCDAEQRSIRDRLELFVLVCRAVQHAHQKGVIHRDLKPSNILVTVIDGAAVPKVIDFGVAKATGATLTDLTVYTGFHQFVGTPLYMSPEQASLSGVDVDTRSDIYALGVLLYELLTGTTPFDSETLRRVTFDELRRIIREQEPQRPSTRLSGLGATLTTVSDRRKTDPRHLGRSLRGELDWIAMKALEKDRRRRYETASDFAADVMRFLTNEPVEACPPSVWYRFSKFLRRNRAVVVPASLLTLFTFLGLLVGMVVVTRERDEARLQRQRADTRFQLAFEAVTLMRFVAPNLRSAAGPEATARLRQAVKDDLIRYHLGLVEHNEDDLAIGFELGDAYLYLSSLYGAADPERRDWAFQKALSAYERRAREKPGDTRVLNALAMHYARFANRYLREEPGRAEATYRKSLDIYERIAREHPERVDDWCVVEFAARWYGDLLRGMGRTADAEAVDRRVLALFERPEVDPRWFDEAEEQSGDVWVSYCELLIRCGQPLRGVPVLARARPHLLFDGQYELYNAGLRNLCLELVSDPDPAVRARAVLLAREGVELMSGTDAQSWLFLAVILDRTTDHQGALDAARRGVELSGDQVGPLNNLAWQLVSDPDDGPRSSRLAVEFARTATERAPKESAPWNTLGVALYRAGQWDTAIEALEKSEALAPDVSFAFNGFFLAMAHDRLGRRDEAREWFEKSTDWMAKNQPNDPELIRFRDEATALLEKEDSDTMMPNGLSAFAH